MSAREQGTAKGNRSGGSLHWGPLAIIGFFICLFVVDSAFLMMAERGLPSRLMAELLPDAQHARAISSVFPGVVSHNFQKQEDLYNQYLLQVEQQRERGWQVRKGWLTKPVLNEPAVFQVVANTREGIPIREAEVTGRFLRPSNSRLDKGFSMKEVEPGVYQSSVTLPAAGTWDLVMQVHKGQDLHEVRARTLVSAP
jgi:nitrogen fixation protein FixH